MQLPQHSHLFIYTLCRPVIHMEGGFNCIEAAYTMFHLAYVNFHGII